MKKIQMVDLQSQYKQLKDKIDNSVINVIEDATFINGPSVKSFQKNLEDYLDVKHVIPCANGTDALQIAMMGLNLKPGDEVITADFTFASTVETIALLNLTPVLVDVDLETFNIDCNEIKKAITSKTKAIVPVHLFGQPANMEEIMEIANQNNLFVIEDNAQAIGSEYQFTSGNKIKAGTIGDIGTTSFFPSKNLGCYGDGGALFTNNDDLAHTIRGIVNHGMYKRYHHDVVGVNSRLDSIQASVLDIKLKFLDNYNSSRNKSAKLYSENLKGNPNIILPSFKEEEKFHVFHQYTIRVLNKKRDDLANYLSEFNIPFGIYYPIPLHRQKAYIDSRYNEEDFSNTNLLTKQVISLPMHSELELDQISFICEKINTFLK
ncbi:MAG: DegT/DnrJ/EryC1/StrS family aminotransferase [Flavobacteriaceae bacterium]|jgi:dTDP-4-amino-4,6-dideoxygalactose transaminase|nr:DegT/DnrJ/EryC1/StrS family aminotransferase [Flavobacteriaceae bacterium]MBT6170273.1 DegT/DnrJ/EryC1/StrS family aminotransferase [Flavobacteriaceae bacterium]MDG1831325.1 DegT/DnrJ/EryC1/StrS family aminotransferase [Flavobacteriaceae bacterium]|tara:strand:+ start:1299 stop:2429 length:1131 start_codon:yes stop_codon:yes gene_type:complete